MFAQFILPFDVRRDPFNYEWVVYLARHRIQDLAIIGPEHYWRDVQARIESSSWATRPDTAAFFGYDLPSQAALDRAPNVPLSADLLENTRRRLTAPALVWREAILRRIPELEPAVRAALQAVGPPEALFLWANCASAEAAARRLGVPTVHQELGPLRPPFFRSTAYFDLRGVNGRTDAERRWRRFLAEGTSQPILTRDALLELMTVWTPNAEERNTHQTGVALQVPHDSNIVAFGKGFDAYEVIATALDYLPGPHLVRAHPQADLKFSDLPVDWHTEQHASQFLARIESLITINSSLALEAMLLGKPTYVMGESPFALGGWNLHTRTPILNDAMQLKWLNWIIFGYLIPFDLLFDIDYCRWRLTDPSEADIYSRNHQWWLDAVKAT